MNENSMNNAVTLRPDRGASLGRIDQYELIRELGGGGFGCVYLAKDTVAGIEVAVKGLPPLVRLNKEELENVRKNFALVSRLHHPNIAAALHLQKVENAFYDDESDAEKLRVFKGDTLVVMQYALGVTLSQWRKQFPEGKVPLDKALEITRQIASALDYAHKERIIHRDIKPTNVMIETGADGSLTARVLDFGLAAEIRSSMSRVSQSITDTSGTRPYMAPEQWLGEKQGFETDQYSLAVLFYELITGEVPFASVFDTGDPALMMNVVGNREFNPPSELPKLIRRALIQTLAKKREDRFASCIEFVEVLSGGMARSKTASRSEVARGLRASSRAAAFLAAVAALGLAIGGIWYWQDSKVKEDNVDGDASKVYVKTHNENEKVQLWEGGPYWATRNIGAEKPEDYGYYFWWGDTVGYKREGDKWVASDGSNSNFSFGMEDAPTYGKSISELQNQGWIVEKNGENVLASKHDAAQAHWGGNWRMPTDKEFAGLCSKCDWIRTTKNGVYGYIVRGKSNYSTKSIFLPFAGYATTFANFGRFGEYWSSVPSSYDDYAWRLNFNSDYHGTYDYGTTLSAGLPVRPVQGFIK